MRIMLELDTFEFQKLFCHKSKRILEFRTQNVVSIPDIFVDLAYSFDRFVNVLTFLLSKHQFRHFLVGLLSFLDVFSREETRGETTKKKRRCFCTSAFLTWPFFSSSAARRLRPQVSSRLQHLRILDVRYQLLWKIKQVRLTIQ